MRAHLLPIAVTGLLAAPAAAAEVKVTVEIPALTVAEYHRPYVAIWLEAGKNRPVTNLAVWYDLKKRDGEGAKWLKDMRQWWRRTGRELPMPVDGISGATRAPGEHSVTFTLGQAPLGSLAAGNYELVVEAAREVGGREILRVSFQWPPAAPRTASVKGDHELGQVKLELAP